MVVDNHHLHTPTKYKKDKSATVVPSPVSLPPHTTRPTRSQAGKLNVTSALGTKSDLQTQSTPPILRANYELESSSALEELLKKREEDLRKRRQHVEHLMKWHQRLDEEEAEVLQLERQLLNYNNVPQHLVSEQDQQQHHQQQQQHIQQMPPLQALIADEEELTPTNVNDISGTNYSSTYKTPDKKRATRARKMERRLKDIDKSLKELSHISASSAANSAIVMGQSSEDFDATSTAASLPSQEIDFVRTTGSKLNKLWKRLTSQTIEKFEPTRRYKLCKADLERLYEDAKMAVLRDFAQDEERIAQELLEKSSLSSIPSPVSIPQHSDIQANATTEKINVLEIPVLNLNFSSGHSEPEEESANNSKMVVAPQGNYSPSVAEENFKAQLLNSSASSSISESSIEQQQNDASATQSAQKQQQQPNQLRIENNVQMFLALTERLKLGVPNANKPGTQHQGLQRSLSDTQIAELPKFTAATSTSHRNISENASQTKNTSITSCSHHVQTSSSSSSSLPVHHQKSKSSIAEITYYIPYEQETDRTAITPPSLPLAQQVAPQKSREESPKPTQPTQTGAIRTSVITAIGNVSSINKTVPITSSSTIRNNSEKLSYSGQVGVSDSDLKAKEISSKLDEISAAVIQLSHANVLRSSTPATCTSSKTTTTTECNSSSSPEEQPSIHEESNLSTDASSYSIHFANISIDRHSSPGSQHSNSTTTTINRTKTPTITNTSTSTSTSISTSSTTFTKEAKNSETLENSHRETFVVSPNNNSPTSKTFVNDNSTVSRTFVKDQKAESPQSSSISATNPTKTVSQSHDDKSSISAEYEPDFEPDSTNETHIEDISLPYYETTTSETTIEGEGDLTESSKEISSLADKTYCADSAQTQVKTSALMEQSRQLMPITKPIITVKSSPEKELLPPPPLPPPPPPPPTSTITISAAGSAITATINSNSAIQINGSSSNNHLMPDILNELELRRHQIILDNEVNFLVILYMKEHFNYPARKVNPKNVLKSLCIVPQNML